MTELKCWQLECSFSLLATNRHDPQLTIEMFAMITSSNNQDFQKHFPPEPLHVAPLSLIHEVRQLRFTHIFTQGESFSAKMNTSSVQATWIQLHPFFFFLSTLYRCHSYISLHVVQYSWTATFPTFAVIIWVCGQLNVECWTECSILFPADHWSSLKHVQDLISFYSIYQKVS